MNEFKLVYGGYQSQLGHYCDILVDDQPLLDWVRDYESAFAGSISGAYICGFNQEMLQRACADSEILLTPFVCNCGDIDCWQLNLTQSCYSDIVAWHNWNNPARSKQDGWDYRDFAPLNFSAEQYFDELKRALKLIESKSDL
ncbi:hypothetical protein ACMXYQ_15310 [Neptuniibacter sp. PT34_22]|uniref:hypothetical protein n=1 Tax=Neptuniibacter sp. PT34_22 TaxID=3398205 RepID=UPI0039F5D36E